MTRRGSLNAWVVREDCLHGVRSKRYHSAGKRVQFRGTTEAVPNKCHCVAGRHISMMEGYRRVCYIFPET